MNLSSWIESSSIRNFINTPAKRVKSFNIKAALNEKFSFQTVLRMTGEWKKFFKIEVKGPAGWSIRARRVGYVPVLHHNHPFLEPEKITDEDLDGMGSIPGYVPDPLFDETTVCMAHNETHSFWITLVPAENAKPGNYHIEIEISDDQKNIMLAKHQVDVALQNIRLGKIHDFDVTNWFYADALFDWYKTDMFDARFWKLFEAYAKNMAEHNQNTIYVPAFTPPLDGVKSPSQLLKISRTGKTYHFDWSDVRKYIKIARNSGITHFEWCHLFTQWGCKNAIRIYEGQGKGEKLLWPPETEATSDTYRDFLSQFLPRLRQFLAQEKILKNSFFHISDEPHGDEHLENYRKARALMKELAPWMKFMDALSDIRFGREKLTEMPASNIEHALRFIEEKIPCWCYFCCVPRGRYLNRFLDTPLAKIAMSGTLFYRWSFKGFLHWGYNYWYKSQTRQLIDPFTAQDGLAWEKSSWSYGDTFMVYPGENGPIDSVRWEIFGESLQDYALYQAAGVTREDDLFKSVKSFEDFPKNQKWRLAARDKCFAKVSKKR